MVALPTWLNLNPPSFYLNNMLFTSPAPVVLLQASSTVSSAIWIKHPAAHILGEDGLLIYPPPDRSPRAQQQHRRPEQSPRAHLLLGALHVRASSVSYSLISLSFPSSGTTDYPGCTLHQPARVYPCTISAGHAWSKRSLAHHACCNLASQKTDKGSTSQSIRN